MEKPKILVFTTAYHPFIGGAEIAIQEIVKRLKDRFDFYIVTSRFRRDLSRYEEVDDVKIIRIGMGTRFDKWLLPFIACFRLGLAKLSQANLGTVLLGVDIGQGALAAAIYKVFHPKVPFVFNVQYGYGENRLRSGRFGAIGLVFRFILGRADFVTVISAHLLDLARRYGYEGPAEVIHNGVDMEKFRAQNENHKITGRNLKIIITTSRLVPKNGIDILIKAVAEVKKTFPDIQCWIIGDGPERKNYQLLVTSYGLKANVRFFGSIPYEELPEYLHRADIFVRPSRSEGMGNSFVEALAAGLPIIGTPVGGITDIIEDKKTGLFARVNDFKDFAEKIIYLLRDQDLGKHIVENGKRMVEERFSWDKIAERYVHVFYRGLTPKKDKSLHILIATPLFPPQLGGPALYAKNLSKEFAAVGLSVSLLSFTKFLRFPAGISHALYFFSFIRRALGVDIIFSLDQTSVGLPSALTSFILRKPLILRVEGDRLWEHFVERTRLDVTLRQFYLKPQPLNWKEKIMRLILNLVLRRGTAVFSSEWRKNIVLSAFSLNKNKTRIVSNVQETKFLEKKGQRGRVIVWAGRFLYLKNLYRLLLAFSKANDGSYQLNLVGEGPERKNLERFVKERGVKNILFFGSMSRPELLYKISKSAFLVLPSLSDVGPNVIADAVATCTPFIITKESGYAELVMDKGLLVDPLGEEDMAWKLKVLMDESTRQKYELKLKSFSFLKSWTEVAQDWLKVFQRL